MRFLQQPFELGFKLALLAWMLTAFGCASARLNQHAPFAAKSPAAYRTEMGSAVLAKPTSKGLQSGNRSQASPSNASTGFQQASHERRLSEGDSSIPVPVNLASARVFLPDDLEDASPSVEVASQVVLDEPRFTENGRRQLTLALLEQMAINQNPALLQVAATINQARGLHQQVGLKPNPTVGYFGQEIGNDGSAGQHGGFVAQTWVRGDKLAWNRRVLAHEISALSWQNQVQLQRVLTDVRITYFDVLSAQLRLQLAEDFRAVAERSVELATDKLEAKVGTRPDLLQSEIQLSEIDLVIQQAEINHSVALQQLAALCGVADLGDVRVAGNFSDAGSPFGQSAMDQEAILAQLYATSPELAVAQANIDRACASLARQKLQPISNLTTQFGLAADDATGDGFTNIQVSLPVPVHNKNQGNIRAATAAYHSALQNAERIRSRLRSDLARALGEYRRAEAEVQNYRDRILPKAQSAMELIQEGKEAGEFDFLRELTARRVFFDSNLRFVSAQADLAQARARIEGNLLTGGLSQSVNYQGDTSLRGQALSGQ